MLRYVRIPSTAALRCILASAGIFFILFLRRPDALTHPQFFAEDGRFFFHDQLLFGGWEALWSQIHGYLLVVPRLIALVGSFFPVVYAPLVYNVAGLTIASVCCAVFFLPAFRTAIRSDSLRFAVCLVMAAGLDSAELVGPITQLQWYLQLAGILLLVYSGSRKEPTGRGAAIVLSAIMLLLALSVPLLIVAVPLAVWFVFRARGAWKGVPIVLLAGIAIQIVTYVSAGATRGHSGIFRFNGLLESTAAYLAFRAVLSSIIGRPTAMLLAARGTLLPSIIVIGGALVWLGWLWRKADASARMWMAGTLYFIVCSTVISVGARDLARGFTFGAERYFYLPACGAVVLVALTLDRAIATRFEWAKPVVLLALFSFGLKENARVAPYIPFPWEKDASAITRWLEALREGVPLRPLTVPINPVGWFFTLDGSVLTNGHFEEPVLVWFPDGDVSVEPTGVRRSDGKVGLAMWGRAGFVRQLLLGVEPAAAMKAQAMVYLPCTGVIAALVVEDGKGRGLARVAADPALCGRWQKVGTVFRTGHSGRLLLRLDYQGRGRKVYWDGVTLERVTDAVFPGWGGVGTLAQSSSR